MGEELVLSRNRFILRLLEQNFLRVDGPRFEDGKNVFYDVWTRSRDKRCVRIAFDHAFLSEPSNDFARATLEALRQAKGMLHNGSGGARIQARQGFGGNQETGYDTA